MRGAGDDGGGVTRGSVGVLPRFERRVALGASSVLRRRRRREFLQALRLFLLRTLLLRPRRRSTRRTRRRRRRRRRSPRRRPRRVENADAGLDSLIGRTHGVVSDDETRFAPLLDSSLPVDAATTSAVAGCRLLGGRVSLADTPESLSLGARHRLGVVAAQVELFEHGIFETNFNNALL